MKKILPLMLIGVLSLGLFVKTVQSQAFSPLVFTENSSTDLTVTMNGTDIGYLSYSSPNRWTWGPPVPPGVQIDGAGLSSKFPTLGAAWLEPESMPSQTLVNLISPQGSHFYYFNIESDLDITNYNPPIPDWSIYNNGEVSSAPSLYVHYNDGSSVYYDPQFIDNGDVSTPEPSTMLLLGSGLIGLWGFRRKFKK